MEHIDALEAVRRLTLERDALADELVNVKDDLKLSHQIVDSIRAATGLNDYGPYLARSLKAMREERDALAKQVKRLEDDTARMEHRRRQEAGGALQGTTGEKAPILCACCRKPITRWLFCDDCEAQRIKERYNGTQTCDGCRHGGHSLCDKMVCTRHAPKHGEHIGARGYWPVVLKTDRCGDWEGK